MLGGFTNTALAADPATLVVVFNPNPLFNQPNFLPGDETSGEVTVTNNTDAIQNIITEAINILDNNNFGSLLSLNISGGTPFNNSLSNFFSTAGEVSLGTIANGESKTFTYTISFINSNDNTYQGKTLGFDICVGFRGGNTHCGNTEIGGENPVDPNDPPGGGSGGTGEIPESGGGSHSGGFSQLVIFNEFISSITAGDFNIANGSATVEWDTNMLSTSQVVYGPVPPGGYLLDTLTLPNLGYPLSTVENSIKVLHHSVLLNGLIGGETYVYRVVSRASPPTVSVEHIFTMPTTGTGGNSEIASTSFTGVSSTGGASNNSGTGQQGEGSEVKQEPFLLNSAETAVETGGDNSNLLAFALGGLNFGLSGLICIGVALIIFLILLWLMWLIFKNKENESLSREVALLVTFGLIVSFILWLIPYTCPIIPFWVIVAIYVIWKLVTRRTN